MTTRLLIALLVLAASAAGSAGMARAEAPSTAVKNEAKQRFALGLSLFEKGDNAAALAEFKRAYELIPNPLVLYNLGLVYAAMSRPVEAVDALDKFLAEGGASVAGEPARRASQVRDEEAARIALVAVVTNKPATIEVDGVEAGRTPLASPLRMTSGTHVISAEAPGCLPSHQEINVPGRITTPVTLTLLPTESSVAHLALAVSVPGAEVFVNGNSVGRTPLPASVAIPPGAATIEVRRPGYRALSRSMRLDEGSSGAITLSLEEDPAAPASLKGRLRLTPSAPVVEVSLDGIARPLAAGGLEVVAGPHLLRVERAGFVPFERSVDVPAGRETSLAVDLVPTPETRQQHEDATRARRIWAWSAIGVGVLGAAGALGYAVLTRNDISQAQAELDAYNARVADPRDNCSQPPTSGEYLLAGCGNLKASADDQISTAKLRRGLAVAGIGLGVAVAGVGTYLLLTGDSDRTAAQASGPRFAVWTDGHGGSLVAAGRF